MGQIAENRSNITTYMGNMGDYATFKPELGYKYQHLVNFSCKTGLTIEK